jgi:hypothetical protein
MVSEFDKKKEDIEIYKNAVAKWGQDLQLNVLIEECAELIEATLDYMQPGMDATELGEKKIEEMNDPFTMFFSLSVACVIKKNIQVIKNFMKQARKKKFSIFNENVGPRMLAESVDNITVKMAESEGIVENEREHLAEELADVEIMIDQARYGMGLASEIDKAKQFKIERLKKRIEKQ